MVSANVFPHLKRGYDAGQSDSRIARQHDGYSFGDSHIVRYAARPQATTVAYCLDGSTAHCWKCVGGIAACSYALLPVLFVYFLLMWLGLIIYMVREVRRYGRWLRDNYADLEHKEVWQSFVVLAIILLVYAIYSLDVGELIYEYALDVIIIVLVCYLLWRVETLSDLTLSQTNHDRSTSDSLLAKNIGPLLKQHCEDTQLYLQHDISLSQLATLIGINRSYLSKHFALQGITYNAYINGLRIQHFINLYHESAATHQPVSAQQLAYQSGFRNCKTFNAAFKKIMEMTATEWTQQVKS